MTLVGSDWSIYVSALGVLTALVGALFLSPSGPQPRNLVMGLGALVALAFPFAFVFTDDTASVGDAFDAAGPGLFVFAGACILAAIVGFLTRD